MLVVGLIIKKFQSTPPARGATAKAVMARRPGRNFNPRPPRGGRPCVLHAELGKGPISIHAPREGGDGAFSQYRESHRYFNPRPPRGGRLKGITAGRHPLLFQSTPPARGATPSRFANCSTIYAFQSTPPARGATPGPRSQSSLCRFQSTPPREGGDLGRFSSKICTANDFNPRPPRGGRRAASRRSKFTTS